MQQIFWQLHRLSFTLEKKLDEVMKRELDIGFAQYKVLEAINHNSLAKQNAVANMLDQTEASISRQVKILEKKGLIKIKDVSGNRRAKELSLSKVGEELVAGAENLINITQANVFSSLNVKEQQWFSSALDRLIEKSRED